MVEIELVKLINQLELMKYTFPMDECPEADYYVGYNEALTAAQNRIKRQLEQIRLTHSIN